MPAAMYGYATARARGVGHCVTSWRRSAAAANDQSVGNGRSISRRRAQAAGAAR